MIVQRYFQQPTPDPLEQMKKRAEEQRIKNLSGLDSLEKATELFRKRIEDNNFHLTLDSTIHPQTKKRTQKQ